MTSSKTYMTEQEHALRLYQDPVFWLENTCGVEATDQQAQLMNAAAYPGSHVAVASGHGVGKSTALAGLALWFLCTRSTPNPDTGEPRAPKIICTAPTAHQLEDVLWSEIRSIVFKMSPWMQEQFTVTKGHVTMRGSQGFVVARTARPEKPDAMQGFHGEELLFLIDEAAGVDEKVYEVAYGALSTPKSRVVCTGNPTELSGFFYDLFHKNKDNGWTTLYFSGLDSPLVDKAYAKLVADNYGVESDMYRVRVLGQFPLSGKNTLIPSDLVQNALNYKMPHNAMDMYAAVLGVDPAWEGDDRSVIAVRRGRYAKICMAKSKMDGEELATEVMRYKAKYNAQHIFVDKLGVGSSCCDFLKVRSVPHVRVYFSAPVDDKETFFNKRIELWWRLRKWFEEGDVCIEDHDGLLADLVAPKYGIRDTGKMYMESKEEMRRRGVRSPDLGDALAMTLWYPYELTMREKPSPVRRNTFIQDSAREWSRKALGLTYKRA